MQTIAHCPRRAQVPVPRGQCHLRRMVATETQRPHAASDPYFGPVGKLKPTNEVLVPGNNHRGSLGIMTRHSAAYVAVVFYRAILGFLASLAFLRSCIRPIQLAASEVRVWPVVGLGHRLGDEVSPCLRTQPLVRSGIFGRGAHPPPQIGDLTT